MKSNAVHSSVSVTKDAGGLLLQYSDVLLLKDRRIAFTAFGPVTIDGAAAWQRIGHLQKIRYAWF